MTAIIIAALAGLVLGACLGCLMAGLCAASRRGEEP